MSNAPRLRPSLSHALSVVLPTADETRLLRACLSSGEAAQQAWAEWSDINHGSLSDNKSIGKVRPLVFNALRSHSLEMDRETQTFLRSAYLKEELRSNIFRRIFRDVLLSLANVGIPTIVLKGTALAETVYDSPELRHCHDIDLLIREQDLSRATELLRPLGFRKLNQRDEPDSEDSKMEHDSGLPLELHSRLFQVLYYTVPLAEMWERSEKRVVAGVETQILSPADNLLHVCGHAFFSAKRESLRWVCDAWFIMDRHRDLNWDLVLNCALRSHLALPLAVTLGYLAEHLNAPIPATFLKSLCAAAAKTDVIEKDLALFGARTACQDGPIRFLRKMKDRRAKVLLIQWMLFPSPTYLFLVEEVRRSWLLPLHYVYRPLRYAWHRPYSRFIGLIRRVKWRIERLFLRINFRTP